METKRKVLDALAGGGSAGSYGTKYDTNLAKPSTAQPQVIEKIGGADGIRTHDLLDAIEARSQLRHGPTGGTKKILSQDGGRKPTLLALIATENATSGPPQKAGPRRGFLKVVSTKTRAASAKVGEEGAGAAG
jgi:hypothetical protein